MSAVHGINSLRTGKDTGTRLDNIYSRPCFIHGSVSVVGTTGVRNEREATSRRTRGEEKGVQATSEARLQEIAVANSSGVRSTSHIEARLALLIASIHSFLDREVVRASEPDSQ
jgi:hypothetical protein